MACISYLETGCHGDEDGQQEVGIFVCNESLGCFRKCAAEKRDKHIQQLFTGTNQLLASSGKPQNPDRQFGEVKRQPTAQLLHCRQILCIGKTRKPHVECPIDGNFAPNRKVVTFA